MVPRPHAGHDPAQRLRRPGGLLPRPRRAGRRRRPCSTAAPGRAAVLPGPAPKEGDKFPPNKTYYEIPIAIQDRSFNADGSLFYPDTRAFFDGIVADRSSRTPTSRRSGTPSSSATRSWSTATPGRSRRRAAPLPVPLPQRLPVALPDPRLQRHPRRRGLADRQRGRLPRRPGEPHRRPRQPAADGPGRAGRPDRRLHQRAGRQLRPRQRRARRAVRRRRPRRRLRRRPIPSTTGQIMQFRVVPAVGADPTTPPQFLRLPADRAAARRRRSRRPLALHREDVDVASTTRRPRPCSAPVEATPDVGPGVVDEADVDGRRSPRTRRSAPPRSGSSTTPPPTPTRCTSTRSPSRWSNRQDIVVDEDDETVAGRRRVDRRRRRSRGRPGFKDTVIAYPGQVTRIRARFDTPGPVRLALPHRRARGQRDDAALPHRPGAARPARVSSRTRRADGAGAAQASATRSPG